MGESENHLIHRRRGRERETDVNHRWNVRIMFTAPIIFLTFIRLMWKLGSISFLLVCLGDCVLLLHESVQTQGTALRYDVIKRTGRLLSV